MLSVLPELAFHRIPVVVITDLSLLPAIRAIKIAIDAALFNRFLRHAVRHTVYVRLFHEGYRRTACSLNDRFPGCHRCLSGRTLIIPENLYPVTRKWKSGFIAVGF